MNKEKIFKTLCSGGYWPELDKQLRASMEEKFIISNLCRQCGKPLGDDICVGQTYWGGYWVGHHSGCTDWKKEETRECQAIDADCNDCRHFSRGKKVSNGIFDGICLKFNKETRAYPNFCSGHKCFEERT